MHILEKNIDKIDWFQLSRNTSIFEHDLKEMTKRLEPFYKELMEKVFHPTRLNYYLQKYNYNILTDEYEYDE
jgi:hypothetical protein